MSDTIGNFKTVASIANHGKLVETYDRLNINRARLEIKEANCEGIQFGFSEFMKNFAFGIIYITQAVLLYYFEDYEFLTQKRIFTA